MSEDVKRQYTSAVRREQAASTRLRILEAAAELFDTNGYGRTTIKQIASKASVASDTVYAVFGSKGRVLTALIDLRLTDSSGVTNVMELPEALAIRDAKDQNEQIHLYARFMVQALKRVGSVYGMMRSAAEVDAEMSAIYEEMQAYRARNAKVIAGWIAKNGPLRVKRDRAGEIIWALASPELSGMLCEQQGWSESTYGAWLEDTLVHALLPLA
jgi:AcrR family transcriptional regulator